MDSSTIVIALLTLFIGLGLGLVAGIRVAERSRGQLRHELRALSAQAVAESSQQVLALADSRVAATEQVVRPVRESLDRLNDRLVDLERSGSSWQAQLKQQVESVHFSGDELRRETRALVRGAAPPAGARPLGRDAAAPQPGAGRAHRALHVRGAGLPQTDDGVLRPDVVVTLAGGKHIVIDAKVSLDAFLSATQRHRRCCARRGAAAGTPGRCAPTSTSWRAKAYWRQFSPSPGVRGDVLAGRGDLRAGARHRPRPDRLRRRQAGHARDADHPDRDAEDGRLRLEPGGGRRQRPRGARSSGASSTSGSARSASTSTASAGRSTARSTATTRPSARSERRVLVSARRMRDLGSATTSSPAPHASARRPDR